MDYNFDIEFINGVQGKWCLSKWMPVFEFTNVIILLPPFGEELNRVRQIFAQLASSLAQQGFLVLLPDFYGTGDSEGNFSDIDLESWSKDFSLLTELYSNYKLGFVACRFGGFLLDFFYSCSVIPHNSTAFNRVVLWQPIYDIQHFWKQISRLSKLKSLVHSSHGSSHKISSSDSLYLESGGYYIPQEFVNQTLSFSKVSFIFSDHQILWLECNENSLAPTSLIKYLNEIKSNQNSNFSIKSIPVSSFWLTQEHTDVTLLLNITLDFFKE